jgi:nucleoside-diphosphate-sugar epimerase
MNLEGKLPILVLGGTGNLGCLILRELLNIPELTVSVLVRDSLKCANLAQKIEQSGGKIITGDVTDPKSIDDITKGIHTVISALEGDDKVIFEGQMNILRDGIKHDLYRFVPSDFCLNIWSIPFGTHYCVDQILKFRQVLEKEKVRGLHFTTGCYMETYFSIVEKDGFLYWEDPNRKMDLISMEDVAKFVAQAVRNPNLSGDVMVSATQLGVKQIWQTYNQITGRNLELKNMGSISDLKELIKKYKNEGNVYDALRFGYYYLVFGEKTWINNRMNDKFGNVNVTSLEQFLEKNKGKNLNELPLLEMAKCISKEKLLNYSI